MTDEAAEAREHKRAAEEIDGALDFGPSRTEIVIAAVIASAAAVLGIALIGALS